MQYSVKLIILDKVAFFYLPWVLFVLSVVLGIIFYLRQKKVIGRFRNVYWKSQDIEKRYTQLVQLLPQTVIELDSKGKIIFLNDAGKALLGLEKFDLLRGIHIFDLIIKDQRERFRTDFFYLLEGGLNKGQEYQIKSKKGKLYAVTIYFSAIYTNDKPGGIRGIIIDITHNKKLEREALSAVMETEERERKRFSEDLHDGLGPQLSTLKLYINQMNTGNNTEEEKRELLKAINSLIDEAITTTRNIANNILPGSISDNGLWPALVSFCDKLEQTGTMKFHLENAYDLDLRKNVESNIYRIIIELINNTIKHARASIINISIKSDEKKLYLVYSDNGIGMKSDASDGMGLINIKNRSAALNGQYRFVNLEGMRFELILPKQEIIIKEGDKK